VRILYVSQYFPPEMGAPAARVHELSREWVRLGHEVTVLTGFAHHPVGIKARQDRFKLTRRETKDGIDVLRAYVYAAANKGTARRMVSYASFMCSASVIGILRASRPDIIIATSPHLLCGFAGYLLAKAMRVPFVFEVRDLWPETILAIDAMQDNILIHGLRGLADFLYNHCDRIVTVGEGYLQSIKALYGISESKMSILHNGIDTDLFVPGPRDNEVRREFGWKDRFVLLYIGTHGMCHGLSSVLEAARELRDEKNFLFVFVGEGAEKDALKKLAAGMQLENVQFIGQQAKERVPLFYAGCDLGVVTLRNSPRFQEVLPSKIFEYLGMERPVLLSVGGEARKLVEEASAGEYVPPEDVSAMVSAIRRLSREGKLLEDMGRKGREYVLKHYDRRVLAKRYLDILKAMCNGDKKVFPHSQ
jgi:colanic acid biosynthesis glycosyl transferase WcaI